MSSSIVPVPIESDDDRWISIHKRFLSDEKSSDAEVIFFGDCILETLQHTQTWNQYFAPMHSLNFSIYEDKTQNTLWRIQNGALDNVKPKVVVLLIGTNNIENSADEISEGISEIVKCIKGKLTDAYIVLPTLLPRGHQPNKLREKNEQVNKLIAEKFPPTGSNKIQTVQIGNGLVQADGTISHHDMFDYLNLTNSGYKKVFEPIYDLLSQILYENEPEKDLTPSE